MKKSKKLHGVLKGCLCLLLVSVTVISSIISSSLDVSADSNDRISTYIKLAADGEITEGTMDGMTEDQLRFLGLYLSNFYIPFGTEIGTSGGELTETTKGDMVDTLGQKLAFSEELATSFVETIFGYTRSSLSELGVYVKDGDTFLKVNIAPNYYNFLRIMLGRSDDVFIKYTKDVDFKNVKTNGDDCSGNSTKTRDKNLKAVANNMYDKDYTDLASSEQENVTLIYEIICGKFGKFYFCYNDGTELIPVCDATIGANFYKDDGSFSYRAPRYDKDVAGIVDYSASQVAFMKCLEASNIEQGYGFSFMDFSVSDGVTSEDISGLANSASNADKAKMSMLGATMAVDCFGDIIIVGANHQVVVIPGCMNPYVWTPVDEEGNEVDDSPAGLYYNIANAISMSQVGTESGSYNELLKKCESKTSTVQGVKLFKANFDVLNSNLDNMKLGYSITNAADSKYAVIGIRTQRGTNNTALNSGFLGTGGTSERDFFISAIDGFKELYPNDFTYFYATSNTSKSSGVVNDTWWSGTATFDCSVPRSRSLGGGVYYGASMNSKLNLLTNVVFVDNLGAYKTSEGQSLDFSAFNVASFIDDTGNTASASSGIKFGNNSFGNLYNDIQSGKMSVPYDASESALSTLYVTYCWASLYSDSNKADTIGKLGYRLNVEGLPSMSDSPLVLANSDELIESQQLGDIQNWTYYLLHPTDGFDYVELLITNKVSHVLLGWHNDITGTNGTGINVGTTKYRSNMGYVTIPDLSEIQWTDSLINLYNDLIPLLIILVMIVMLIAFISGVLNIQQAIIGVLLFSIFTFIPVNLINAVVECSNQVSQNIYGDKFTYWALVQSESYYDAIDEAANATGSEGTSTYDNYLRTLYAENQSVYTNQGNESILVKWQAPKKMASLVLTEEDSNSLSGLSNVGRDMLTGMLNRSYSGQSYLDDEDAVYMYRSYTDISNFSRYIYTSLENDSVAYRSVFGGSGSTLSCVDITNWSAFKDSNGNLYCTATELANQYREYINCGYTNGTNFNAESDISEQFYLTVPLSSNIISDALEVSGKLGDFENTSDNIPINSDVFNFGLTSFNNSSVNFDIETFAATGNISQGTERYDDLKTFMEAYPDEEDYVGLAAYGLYSENPYYYFSWKLYADGLDSESSLKASSYKDLILGQDNGGYFYNTTGNGELKDFMNMRGLFTYIIPYMKQCNDLVREWDDIYGIFIYDGVPTEEGHWQEIEAQDDPELASKYWHNVNVSRLYTLYCPWVDVMYDCSYADSEVINVLGEKVVVEDPLDPNSYPDDRPMIFSESEMVDYGLTEADLTEVEKLILKCNEGYLDRMYDLLNYYTFSDTSINSAAAINCTFVFNNTFSESGLFTENHNIYPQSFDLSNFSYDAFLRLILSNATGEELLDTTEIIGTASGSMGSDFYEKLINNSSIVTAVVMLIVDVLSSWVIPGFRIFFLIIIFLSMIFLVLVSLFHVEDNMNFVKKVAKNSLLPLLQFFGATIIFSVLVSLFMGTGNDSVTQSNDVSISMGDPVITMLLMIVLDIVLILVYFKVIQAVIKNIKHDSKLVNGFMLGVGGAVTGVFSGISNVVPTVSSVRGSIRSYKSTSREKSNSEALKTIAENTSTSKPQSGTGIESSRAVARGSSIHSSDYDEETNERDTKTNSREFRENNSKEDNNKEDTLKKQKKIDEKATSGETIIGGTKVGEAKRAKESED